MFCCSYRLNRVSIKSATKLDKNFYSNHPISTFFQHATPYIYIYTYIIGIKFYSAKSFFGTVFVISFLEKNSYSLLHSQHITNNKTKEKNENKNF